MAHCTLIVNARMWGQLLVPERPVASKRARMEELLGDLEREGPVGEVPEVELSVTAEVTPEEVPDQPAEVPTEPVLEGEIEEEAPVEELPEAVAPFRDPTAGPTGVEGKTADIWAASTTQTTQPTSSAARQEAAAAEPPPVPAAAAAAADAPQPMDTNDDPYEGLANMFEEEHGSGFGDILKEGFTRVKTAVLGSRDNFSPRIRKLLEKEGGQRVVGIEVYRKPIQGMLNQVINLLTLGKMEEAKKAANYDDLFHLFCVLTLADGTRLLVEKNHVISMQKLTMEPGGEHITVQAPGNLTLQRMLDNTKLSMGANFFTYNAITNNCQNFVINLLQSNGVMLSEDQRKFILQDVQSMKLPGYTQGLFKGVTDLAAKADVLVHGAGRT